MERIDPAKVTLKIARFKKNGRGGKTVTVLFELPNNQTYFSDLAKQIKNNLGTGGTFKNDCIEIQGDHRVRLQTFLEKMGFKVRA